MHCEPPAITFIPCEEHFRPVLPTIEGNVDYLALRGQLTTIDELLRTSGVENEFLVRSLKHWVKTLSQSEVEQMELSGEGQCGVIRLEELIGGKQQVRFQQHSIRALRCTIARTLLGGSFRDFAARMADSPLLQWFCRVGQLERVKVPAKSTSQRYGTWLPEEEMRELAVAKVEFGAKNKRQNKMKRRRFRKEQIIGILKEAEGEPVKTICARHNVNQWTYYQWKNKYGGMKVEEPRRLRALEDENARLKRVAADQAVLSYKHTETVPAFVGRLWHSNIIMYLPNGSR
jgi:putative transposase